MKTLLLMFAVLLPLDAFADDTAECLKSCEDMAKMCNTTCSKNAKGNAGICKPQCQTVLDACKKDCKDQGSKAPPPPPPETQPK